MLDQAVFLQMSWHEVSWLSMAHYFLTGCQCNVCDTGDANSNTWPTESICSFGLEKSNRSNGESRYNAVNMCVQVKGLGRAVTRLKADKLLTHGFRQKHVYLTVVCVSRTVWQSGDTLVGSLCVFHFLSSTFALTLCLRPQWRLVMVN